MGIENMEVSGTGVRYQYWLCPMCPGGGYPETGRPLMRPGTVEAQDRVIQELRDRIRFLEATQRASMEVVADLIEANRDLTRFIMEGKHDATEAYSPPSPDITDRSDC